MIHPKVRSDDPAAMDDDKALRAVAVLDVRGVNLDRQQVAIGVGQDVALSAVDALSHIEAFEAPF